MERNPKDDLPSFAFLLRKIISEFETAWLGVFELLFKHHYQAQRIWPLLSSLTPIPKLPPGAVEGKALGKDLRKKVLTESRFPIASAKGKTSIAMR
jgi:hypothetical protein